MKRKSNSTSRRSNTFVDKKGYKRVKGSNTLVHRWAAEKKLGRELKPGEVVHHKNRDKQDNSFNNLHIFGSQQAHWEAHKQDAQKYGREYSMTGKNKNTST